MERLLERCAALDVHQASVSACVRVGDERGERLELNERFGTTTPDLLAAARPRSDARGDGGDGRLLEAGLLRARG